MRIHKAPPSVPLSGAELLQTNDAAKIARINSQLRLRAMKAREDPKVFFEFVMRDEEKHEPIKILPHQKLAIDFIMHHTRSVHMWPIGFSKTFLMASMMLWFLGRNPNMRIVIVSAKAEQAEKVLSVVRSYIETSVALKAVFPELRPSSRPGDPWTQSRITIERDPGIKDASISTAGMDGGALPGSRLDLVYADDMLDRQNTTTRLQRDKVVDWLFSSVFDRLDGKGRAIVTNVPWNYDDLVHRLSRRPPKGQGWASLRMDIEGDIFIDDDARDQMAAQQFGLDWTPFDSPEIRPKYPGDTVCRLIAHDPDPHNEIRLWPEKYDDRKVFDLKNGTLRHEYIRKYMTVVRRDDESMCKEEDIEKCLARGREVGHHTFARQYSGPDQCFTGVDLAIKVGEEHDDTSIVSFRHMQDGSRMLLDIDRGKWGAAEIVSRVARAQHAYNSIVRVESNGGQDFLRQWMLHNDRSFPVKAHNTTSQKAHPELGVPGFFLELQNGSWILPCSPRGEVPPELSTFIDACLRYVPEQHTDDSLMAMYFAREQAKKWGMHASVKTSTGAGGPGLAAQVMQR